VTSAARRADGDAGVVEEAEEDPALHARGGVLRATMPALQGGILMEPRGLEPLTF
jgi:hypothetical protein